MQNSFPSPLRENLKKGSVKEIPGMMAPELPKEIDFTKIREWFPLLQTSIPSRSGEISPPLIYLDNAATTQKPLQVLEALDYYYRHINANVHRGLHYLAEKASQAYEDSRSRVARFLGAEDPRTVVFTRGTTESINLVASCFASTEIKEGDEILLTEMEHHSNLVPWQMAAKAKGARLRFIPFKEDGTLNLERLQDLLTPRTKIVGIVHVSNVFGTINEISTVIQAAHSLNIPVLVDAAQSVPHCPVDVKELDCDFLAFSGHKIYGPMGIGVLYAKEQFLEKMPPYQGGGQMIQSVWLERSTWNEIPHKFEAGTPNVAGAFGLKAALDFVEKIGREKIFEYESALTEYAANKLREIPGLTIYGDPPKRASVISFNLKGLHAHDVAQFLDSLGIAVRAGHHCAYPIMRKLGVPATIRASFSFYNTYEEVDCLVAGLRRAQEFFKNVP